MRDAQCGICEGRFDSGRRQTLGWESRQSGQAGAVNPAVNQFENQERSMQEMPEKVVNLLNAIEKVKGKAYTEGLVDMANILAPSKAEEKEEKEEKEDGK